MLSKKCIQGYNSTHVVKMLYEYILKKKKKWKCYKNVYINYLLQETEEKLKETMHVLSMQRSKSDLDVRPPDAHGIGGPIHGAGMFREVRCFVL